MSIKRINPNNRNVVPGDGLDKNLYVKAGDVNPLIDQVNTNTVDIAAIVDGFLYQGVIDCSTTPNYPAATQDQYWRVSVAGLIGGGSGTAVEAGDDIICITTSVGGTQAAVGTSYMIVQKNMVPCTVADLRTGTDNAEFVTAKTLKDQGITTAAATIVALAGGTTEQLKLTSTVTQKGLLVIQTASKSQAIDIISAIDNTTVRIIGITTSMTTAFTSPQVLDGLYFTHTSNGTDVEATVNGVSVYLSSTALSKISFNGYNVNLAGTYTAAAGAQVISGLYMVPTITLNSATTTLYGINVDLSGVTRTAAAAVYAGRFITASTSTSAILASNGTNTVDICNTTNAINISGTSTNGILIGGTLTTGISIGVCTTGINFTGLVAGNAIDFNAGVSVTGSLIDYIGINGKTSGYLFNGSMTTSVLDASTLIDDFSCTCAHDGLAADTLRGIRRIWTGAMPNGTAAPDFILAEYEWNGTYGNGGALGGTPSIMKLSSTTTINDSVADFNALNIDLSAMTLTSVNNIYGIKVLTMAGVDAAIHASDGTRIVQLCWNGSDAIYTNGTIRNIKNAGVASTPAAGTITAAEYGDGKHHITILTLAAARVGSVAAAALAIGQQIYELPTGVQFYQVTDYRLAFDNDDASCDTDDPLVGIGSVVGSGAVFVLNATATFMDYMTEVASINCDGTYGAIVGPVAPTAGFATGIALNAVGLEKSIFLNCAETWTGTTNITVTGTITLVWDTLE